MTHPLPDTRNDRRGAASQSYETARRHTETAEEARQGPLGKSILYVLIGGLLLGAVYLIGTQIWAVSEDLPPSAAVEPAVPVPDPAVGLPSAAVTPVIPAPADPLVPAGP